MSGTFLVLTERDSGLSILSKVGLMISVELSRREIIQRTLDVDLEQGVLRTENWIMFTLRLFLCRLHLFIFWPACLCALFLRVMHLYSPQALV